ncbi:protein of unknown function [Hyphomicrobium sp. 1Nfss2.1]
MRTMPSQYILTTLVAFAAAERQSPSRMRASRLRSIIRGSGSSLPRVGRACSTALPLSLRLRGGAPSPNVSRASGFLGFRSVIDFSLGPWLGLAFWLAERIEAHRGSFPDPPIDASPHFAPTDPGSCRGPALAL